MEDLSSRCGCISSICSFRSSLLFAVLFSSLPTVPAGEICASWTSPVFQNWDTCCVRGLAIPSCDPENCCSTTVESPVNDYEAPGLRHVNGVVGTSAHDHTTGAEEAKNLHHGSAAGSTNSDEDLLARQRSESDIPIVQERLWRQTLGKPSKEFKDIEPLLPAIIWTVLEGLNSTLLANDPPTREATTSREDSEESSIGPARRTKNPPPVVPVVIEMIDVGVFQGDVSSLFMQLFDYLANSFFEGGKKISEVTETGEVGQEINFLPVLQEVDKDTTVVTLTRAAASGPPVEDGGTSDRAEDEVLAKQSGRERLGQEEIIPMNKYNRVPKLRVSCFEPSVVRGKGLLAQFYHNRVEQQTNATATLARARAMANAHQKSQSSAGRSPWTQKIMDQAFYNNLMSGFRRRELPASLDRLTVFRKGVGELQELGQTLYCDGMEVGSLVAHGLCHGTGVGNEEVDIVTLDSVFFRGCNKSGEQEISREDEETLQESFVMKSRKKTTESSNPVDPRGAAAPRSFSGKMKNTVAFLKVDAERNDFAVLRGASEMLRAKQIQFLAFEKYGSDLNADGVVQWLFEEHGYLCARILHSALLFLSGPFAADAAERARSSPSHTVISAGPERSKASLSTNSPSNDDATNPVRAKRLSYLEVEERYGEDIAAHLWLATGADHVEGRISVEEVIGEDTRSYNILCSHDLQGLQRVQDLYTSDPLLQQQHTRTQPQESLSSSRKIANWLRTTVLPETVAKQAAAEAPSTALATLLRIGSRANIRSWGDEFRARHASLHGWSVTGAVTMVDTKASKSEASSFGSLFVTSAASLGLPPFAMERYFHLPSALLGCNLTQGAELLDRPPEVYTSPALGHALLDCTNDDVLRLARHYHLRAWHLFEENQSSHALWLVCAAERLFSRVVPGSLSVLAEVLSLRYVHANAGNPTSFCDRAGTNPPAQKYQTFGSVFDLRAIWKHEYSKITEM
ncbi:unnamed protein product [Amoebophrya sp. A120]|nr:unnamed protein product [Amoebophrya sp. A120]|eukprot:GSA120T00001543001.1